MSSPVTKILELRSVRGTGGGPEKTILLGAERSAARFAVTVCYVRDERDEIFSIDERARKFKIDYVEAREKHSFDLGLWGRLLEIVRSRKIDIIHGHDYKTNLLALLAARRTGAIPLSTAHGWAGKSLRERWLYYPIDKLLTRGFPLVIAVSTEVKHKLVAGGADAKRIVVILNGIDPAAFQRSAAVRAETRQELGIGDADFAIGLVGRLEELKRFDLAIDSFAALRSQHPHLKLVLLGDGTLKTALMDRAKELGVADSCLFLGHRTDIVRIYQAFDLFVQSSATEGTPNVVLEAMALEVPIVATDVGGTRELAPADTHAILVPPNDGAALQEAVGRVLADRNGALRRAQASRKRIEDELSFDTRTRRVEAVYDSLMESAARRA